MAARSPHQNFPTFIKAHAERHLKRHVLRGLEPLDQRDPMHPEQFGRLAERELPSRQMAVAHVIILAQLLLVACACVSGQSMVGRVDPWRQAVLLPGPKLRCRSNPK